MKVLLTILCAIVVLFAGGCGLLLVTGAGFGGMFQAGGLAFLPLGVAALNVVAIGALWGKFLTQKWTILALAIIDAAVVAATLIFWSQAGAASSSDNLFIGLPTLAIAVKGILSYFYWRKL